MSNQEKLSDFAQGEQARAEWEERTFSEVIEVNNYPPLEKGEEQTYVAMDDLDEFERKVKRTSKKEYKYSAPRFKNGDTLFPKMSRCLELGKTAYVDVLDENEIAFGSTEFMVMRPKEEEVLPKFVYYTVRREDIRQHALSWATGSTARRQRISTDLFDNLTIKIPPVEEQKDIVGFVDAIDTKIETNNRINELLEEIAQSLYRSWFVDFDPYDDFKDSELGEIPVEFDVKTVEEICEINHSSINDDNFDHSEIEYLDISSTDQGKVQELQTYNIEDAPDRAKRVVNDGDTVLSTVRPGREQYTYMSEPVDNLVVSTGFVVLRTKEEGPMTNELLYYSCTQPMIIKYLENNTTGSAYPAVNLDVIRDMKLPIPPQGEVDRFSKKVEPSLAFKSAGKKENETLSDLRDTLLPKLISGEIRLDPDSNNEQTTKRLR